MSKHFIYFGRTGRCITIVKANRKTGKIVSSRVTSVAKPKAWWDDRFAYGLN